MNRNIAIIGAGFLGMTLALRLADKGYKTTLIEKSEQVGGLAGPSRIGDYTWDRFYHVFLLSDSNTINLLDELNLADKIQWGQTKTGFLTEGNLYSMSNVLEFLSFPPLNLFDKFRLGATIFYASKIRSWQRLEGISVTQWLTRLSGKRTFSKIWLPLLRSKLGDNYKRASASFIWAIIARMYAARRSGLKQEMFGYVHGGYAPVLDRLKSLLNEKRVEILCQTPLIQVRDHEERVELKTASGQKMAFDDVILTIPCAEIPKVCPQLCADEKRKLNAITYQGVVCAALLLKKALPGYYITNITDDGVPFTSVIEMTALVNRGYFDGNSLIYLPRYLTQEDPFWRKTDQEIRAEFVSSLEEMYPIFRQNDVLDFKVFREDYVLPITTLDYSTELMPFTKMSLEHVFLANSAQIANGTMNLNEIIGLANRKAEEVAKRIEKSV